jgi:FtsZ-binding cell division protein ZapB
MGKEKKNSLSREERLATKLRENLRRRKVQAKEMIELSSEMLPKNRQES